MAVKLNHGAEGHAKSLIDAGKYDDTSPWSFEAADGDKLLGPNGDDWAEYRQWFLGEDGGPSNEKGTYSYPYGKSGKVYGQGLRAIRSRASTNGATDVFDAAGRLLDQLNKKTGAKDKAGAYYRMRAQGSTAEIFLYQEIGDGGGFFGDPGIRAEFFAQDLRALGKVSQINCRINSPGGNVFEGMSIYNLLAAHPAQVVCHIDGLAASIASVIAMAGDVINIADNGMMMVHNAWGVAVGTADEIRETANLLDQLSGTIASTYAKRSGTDTSKISSLMQNETWMTANEAKGYGLVDNVVDNMKAAACAFDPKRFGFRKAPQALLAAVAATPRRDRYAGQFLKARTTIARLKVLHRAA
jgi:ATP-dependent Clp endopeptidase proteolytic subunit ClpP